MIMIKSLKGTSFPPVTFHEVNSSTQSFSAFSLPEEWLKYGE